MVEWNAPKNIPIVLVGTKSDIGPPVGQVKEFCSQLFLFLVCLSTGRGDAHETMTFGHCTLGRPDNGKEILAKSRQSCLLTFKGD